jgi:elongation factor G
LIPEFMMESGIRNIGILAHIDAGKTSLTEAILYASGAIRAIGSVDEGNTETDWMELERERGITISAAATYCAWKDSRIIILDTPGHVDFGSEVQRSLRAMDSAVIVLCGVAGIQAQTEAVLKACDDKSLSRIVFVNKLDRRGASYSRCLSDLARHAQVPVFSIQFPYTQEDKFFGMYDLINGSFCPSSLYRELGQAAASVPAPESLPEFVQARIELLDDLADLEEDLMECILSGGEPKESDIRAALRAACISGKAVLALGGSALSTETVRALLDAIVDFLPSPAEAMPPLGFDTRDGSPVTRRPIAEEAFSALIFKQAGFQDIGRIVFLRIYSGRLKPGAHVLNASLGRTEKVQSLYRLRANRVEVVKEALAGDIVAATGLKDSQTGHSLCDPSHPILYEPIEFAEPVMSVALEPRDRAQSALLASAVHALSEEDPSLRVEEEPESGRIRLSGIGELQIEIALSRLSREFGLRGIKQGKPEVAFKESIASGSRAELVFDREIDYKRHFARVELALSPAERGSGVKISSKIEENSKKTALFTQAALRGARQALESFGRFGYPLADIAVTLESLGSDAKDSSELAFEAAASMAARNALMDAKPIILEPYMRLEVGLPEDALGEVVASIHGRQGRIELIEDAPDGKVVSAYLSMRTLFGLAGELRSDTGGRLTLSQRFSHYEILPSLVPETK